ncbi:MAG TPA: hypothetical protein VL285_25035 [Bryobacteraceae bacterium]|nr:hypothetical protein [Bryobacteraceae bacterium]
MRLAIALLLGLPLLARAGDGLRWRLQYFHDKERSTFVISDLKFPSPRRGIAVGAILEGSSVKPMSAITSDGGEHWSQVPLQEPGVSLFFLNDSLGWMVTTKGIWRTEEAGRGWRKLKSLAGLTRVCFLDPDHGWAVGARKQFYRTANGGSDWTKAPELADLKSSDEYTTFSVIEFAGKDQGIAAGWSQSPRRSRQDLPDWLDPESAALRRERPHLAVSLETTDGGKTWKPSAASTFGRTTAIRFSSDGWGLGLVEYTGSFEWPAEVFMTDWKTHRKPRRIYREKDRKVTDVLIAAPPGPIYLGALEHQGRLQLPIPAKVKILKSEDAVNWTEMEVDYRAVATRVILAAAGKDELWAATDTGMILKLK